MTKGFSLSLNAVILIAIAVLVLAALSVFFVTSSLGGLSETEAQRLFAVGCTRYCEADLYGTFRNAYLAAQNDAGFIAACKRLGHGDQQYPNRCLERCTNCFTTVEEEDLRTGLDNINAITGR